MSFLTAYLISAAFLWPPLAIVIVVGTIADRKYQAEKAAGLHQRPALNNPWPSSNMKHHALKGSHGSDQTKLGAGGPPASVLHQRHRVGGRELSAPDHGQRDPSRGGSAGVVLPNLRGDTHRSGAVAGRPS